MVRYLAPDAAERVAGFSPVQASKYGAKTRAGIGLAATVAASAWFVAMVTPVTAAAVATRVSTDIKGLDNRMSRSSAGIGHDREEQPRARWCIPKLD
ncbi:hypothetical protein Acsp05_31990 [Actinokineospora sp. NBRC 105648]|nr:hypothetical protein Acsp05_31990 [Actinokineospora sp. NBRC 105648]